MYRAMTSYIAKLHLHMILISGVGLMRSCSLI